MANYLLTHYKGKYKILCEYDQNKNLFSRKEDGSYEDIDCYISCYNNIQIFYFGNGILEAYVPSIGRGRNIVKAIIEEFGEDVLIKVEETDEEVIFQFKAKHMDNFKKYLKPKTSASNRSPFSTKNLPKSAYIIPSEDFVAYENIKAKIPPESILILSQMTQKYLKTLVNKKHKWESIKEDMTSKGMKAKEYIHSIGKWNDYIKFLENELCR